MTACEVRGWLYSIYEEKELGERIVELLLCGTQGEDEKLLIFVGESKYDVCIDNCAS